MGLAGLSFPPPTRPVPNFYSPDNIPVSPSALNDEFLGRDGAWVSFGTLLVPDTSTFPSFFVISDTSTVESGFRKSFTPGANPFTVVTKVQLDVNGAFNYGGLILTDAADSSLAVMTIQNNNTGAPRTRSGPSGGTTANIAGGKLSETWYLRIRRDGTTNYICDVGVDGLTWFNALSFSQAGTVARVRLAINEGGAPAMTAMFDFIRFFASQTNVIGS